MKRIKWIFALLLVLGLIAAMVSGCDIPQVPATGAPGAGGSGTAVDNATQNYQNGLNLADSTYGAEMGRTEVNQNKLDTVQPAPSVAYSNTRASLIRRMNLIKDPNHIFYIYLMSYGRVMDVDMSYGIPQSVNSLLTDPTQVISDPKNGSGEYSEGVPSLQTPSPDMDGTYGENGPEGTVFFFTTSGAYREWHGDYEISDQPFTLNEQPALTHNVQ